MIQLDFTQAPKDLPVNMFLHPHADHGKPAMVNFPGYSAADDVTSGFVRDCVKAGTKTYWLIDDDLYSVDGTAVAFTLTSVQAAYVGTSTGQAIMVTDGDYICTVDGSKYLYWYKISTDTNGSVDLEAVYGYSKYIGLTYQDGYFIACSDDSSYFFVSDLNDPETWNALSLEDEEYKPDYAMAVHSFQRKLFVFGSDSYAIYENTGNTDFPFERIPGAVFDIGIATPSTADSLTKSIQTCGNAFYFLANDNTVKRISAFEAETVSSPVVNNFISANFDSRYSYAFTLLIDGMWFYVISLLSGVGVFALNTTTWQWTRIKASAATGASSVYPIRCSVVWEPLANVYEPINYCGLVSGGAVVELSRSVFGLSGAVQYREIQSEVMDAKRKRMFFGSFELYAKTAVGSATVNPTVSVQWSDDQGSTWSTARTLYLGLSGKTGIQLRTHMLGSSYNRVFKITSSNIYELQLYGAYAE